MTRWPHRVRLAALSIAIFTSAASVQVQSRLGSGTVAPVPGDEGWLRYRNTRLGFEVEFPAGWTVSSTEPHGNLVDFTPPASEEKLSEVSFGPVQPIRSAWFSDFDRWVSQYERDLSISGSRLRSRQSLTVAGFPAMRVTHESRLPGMSPRTVVDFLIGVPEAPEGLVYRFFYVTDVSRGAGPRDDAIYQRMLSSLKILRER